VQVKTGCSKIISEFGSERRADSQRFENRTRLQGSTPARRHARLEIETVQGIVSPRTSHADVRLLNRMQGEAMPFVLTTATKEGQL
jgi:hypothetical protein